MDTILIVPTVGALRNTFPIAPETYKLSRTPTSTEVTKLHTCVKANLKAITCLLPNTDDIEWAWIIQTPQEWADLFEDKIADDADYVPPPLPVLRRPGLFTIESKWSNIEITREKEAYHQQLYLHTYKTNLEKAIIKDLAVAIPSSLVSDLQDIDGCFTKTTLINLLSYLDTSFLQVIPKDIGTIMDTFRQPFDETLTLAEYCKRQQDCQADLKDTLEPISTATMIRTSYSHFLTLPHMGIACDEWETAHPSMQATTWPIFKAFFTQKFRQHHNKQSTLRDAGIANSATTDDYNAIQHQLAGVRADNATRDSLFAQMAEHNQQLSHQLHTLAHSASSNATRPPVPELTYTDGASTAMNTTLTSTDVLTMFADLHKRFDNLSATSASTRPNPNTRSRSDNRNHNRTARKYQNENYCWTHGADIHKSHTGSTCNSKATGHMDNATLTNRMGGSDKHVKLVLRN